MIKAVIFDFDGLILETERADFESWRELYAEHNLTLELDSWVGNIGGRDKKFDPWGEIARVTGDIRAETHYGAKRYVRYRTLARRQPLMPGVEDCIVEAKSLGLKLGLASSSARAWVEGHMEERGLDVHFDATAYGDESVEVKPAPDIYLNVLDRLGVACDEAIALEDSPKGAQAAKTAGIYVVAVPSDMTRTFDFPNADQVVNSLTELHLADLVRKLAD